MITLGRRAGLSLAAARLIRKPKIPLSSFTRRRTFHARDPQSSRARWHGTDDLRQPHGEVASQSPCRSTQPTSPPVAFPGGGRRRVAVSCSAAATCASTFPKTAGGAERASLPCLPISSRTRPRPPVASAVRDSLSVAQRRAGLFASSRISLLARRSRTALALRMCCDVRRLTVSARHTTPRSPICCLTLGCSRGHRPQHYTPRPSFLPRDALYSVDTTEDKSGIS